MIKIKANLPLALACVLLSVVGCGCTKELRTSWHLSRGSRDFQAQKYDQAEIEYLKVLQLSPQHPEAVKTMGLIYQEEGKLVDAHFLLTRAAQQEPANSQLRLKLALNELALGDLRKAVEDARLVLAMQPGQEEALQIIAGAAMSTNGLQEIQQEIARFQRADTDRASYHAAYGILAMRSQNVTNAETEFKKALELDPKSSAAYLGMASIYLARKDLAAAEQALKTAADLSPIRSVNRLKYAQFEFGTGKQDEARQLLQQITAKAPDYLPAWNLLAQIAFEQKKYDECNTFVQRVLARDSINLDAMMLNGNVKLIRGDSTNAVANFTRMASVYGGSPQVLYLLGRAQLMNNETVKAIASLKQAASLNPDFADAVLLLANLNIRKGDASQAISSLTALLKRQPRLAQGYLVLARAYVANKQPDQAVLVLRQLAQVYPNSAEVQFNLGSLLESQNQKAEARAAFEKALSISPDYMAAIEKLTDLDLADKQYASAIQRVQALIDKRPKAAEPLILLGKVYIAQAQTVVREENQKNGRSAAPKLHLADVPSAQPLLQQAETALLKAIDLNPNLRDAYLTLADLYLASGKQQQGLDRLNGLLSKTNDVVALMQVGMIQDSLKNYAAARDAYEKLLTINPNFTVALNNLAFIYTERLVDLDKAYKLAERARQLLPNDPIAADTLGWVLYRRGDYTLALPLLEESAAKFPNDTEIQFHLGITQYMLGNVDARVTLQQAAQSTKDFPGKELIGQKLAVLAIDPKTADAASIAALQKQLQETPRDPIALSRLGAIQERDGAFDKAVETYQTALKYDPKNPVLSFKLAQLYASSRINDPQKALALAKTAHEQSPDNPHISALLGQLVYRTGDCRWAASLLEDGARKLPDDPQVTFDLAWAYYGIGRVADGRDLMQKVASADASFAKADEAKRFLQTVAAADSPAQAAAFLPEAKKSLSADPMYVPALMVSAIAQEGQGNYQGALETYNKVLSRFPLFTPATRNIGLLYFARLNDDQKAYDLVTKAREAFPQDPDIAKALGVLTYRKGNYPRAVQLLKESSQTRKSDAELLYYLGMAQYQLKAKPESKASLQQALSFNLSAKLADEAKRVLAELK